jgi:hypothetical protein
MLPGRVNRQIGIVGLRTPASSLLHGQRGLTAPAVAMGVVAEAFDKVLTATSHWAGA